MINPLAAMAYQFPCAEPIYCNFMLKEWFVQNII